ncbi:MAG: hypothetical protein OXG11_07490 [Chloroflexi bacterium]|nr:hypothetical protein [Chloroflexota bacterium]
MRPVLTSIEGADSRKTQGRARTDSIISTVRLSASRSRADGMRKLELGRPREIHGVATKLSLTLCVLRVLTDGVLEGLDDRYPVR